MWHNYLVARRRWRSFANTSTRAHRRLTRKSKGGKKHFEEGSGNTPFEKSHFLQNPVNDDHDPSSAFFGKGGRAKCGQRRSPTANGKVLKCLACDSEEHLIKDCPRKEEYNKSRQSFVTTPAPEQPTAVVTCLSYQTCRWFGRGFSLPSWLLRGIRNACNPHFRSI